MTIAQYYRWFSNKPCGLSKIFIFSLFPVITVQLVCNQINNIYSFTHCPDSTQRDVWLLDGAEVMHSGQGRIHHGVLQVLPRPARDAADLDAAVGAGTQQSDAGPQEEEELIVTNTLG